MYQPGEPVAVRDLRLLAQDVFTARETTNGKHLVFSLPCVITHSTPTVQCKVRELTKQWCDTLSPIVLIAEFFSQYDLHGYGGVEFTDGSLLQTRLLQMGLAKISRPCFPIKALLDVEAAAATSVTDVVAAVAHHETRRFAGRIVDVIRGDLFRLLLDGDSIRLLTPDEKKRRGSTLILMLASVKCADLTSESGYDALRFSRRFLHCEARATVLQWVPSDKDIANNSQLHSYHQLEHCVASVDVWERKSGQWICLEQVLLREGHCKLLEVASTLIPRAPNFPSLLLAIEDMVVASTTTTRSEPSTLEVIWKNYLMFDDPYELDPTGPRQEPDPHQFTPLCLLSSKADLVRQRVTLRGYVHAVEPLPHLALLRLQLMIELSDRLVNQIGSETQEVQLGELHIDPPPMSKLGMSVDCSIHYDPQMSGIDPATCRVQASVANYIPSEFDLAVHKPKYDDYKGEIIALQVSPPSTELLFVVDARVTFTETSDHLHARRYYVLTSTGRSFVAGMCTTLDDQDESSDASSESFVEGDNPLTSVRPFQRSSAGGAQQQSSPLATTTAPTLGIDAQTRERVHHSLIDVFFPWDGSAGDAWVEWIFRDAEVDLQGLCRVEGALGAVGDVRLCLLGPSESSRLSLKEELCQDKNHPIVQCAATFLDAFQKEMNKLSEEGHIEASDPHVKHRLSRIPVPTVEFGRSSPESFIRRAEDTPALQLTSAIPPTASFFAFAVLPRMLFASHQKHHRNVVPDMLHKDLGVYAHIDAAFFRMTLPAIPNLNLCDWERLPLTLRGVQLSKLVHLCGEKTKVFGMSRCIASLLAVLLSVFPKSEKAPPEQEETWVNFSLGVDHLRVPVLLTSVTRADGSRVLLLRSRRNEVLPEGDARIRSTYTSSLLKLLVAALATEVLTEEPQPGPTEAGEPPSSDGREGATAKTATSPPDLQFCPNDYDDRVLHEHGMGFRRNRSVEAVYSPTPEVAVLGSPLCSRLDPMSGSYERFMLQYTVLHPPKTLPGLYRVTSYGRVGRDIVVARDIQRGRHGTYLVDYFNCLLHHTAGSGPADGIFRAYGNAMEPLHLQYAPRRTLMDLLSYVWHSVWPTSSPPVAGQPSKDEELIVFHRLLEVLCSIVDHIAQTVSLPCSLWAESFLTEKLAVISVYPIDEGSPKENPEPRPPAPKKSSPSQPDDPFGTDASKESAVVARDAGESFEPRGNTLGRLASLRVNITWVGGSELLHVTSEIP